MYGDSNMETYTLLYVKQIASGNLLCDSESSNRGFLTTRGLEWGGRWEGGLRGKEHMYAYGSFMLMYGINQHNTIL